MKMFTVEMPNGDVWGVPVDMIARDRAKHYAHEFGGDVERSLYEDTLPLFGEKEYEIEDWAVNNMNWSDFDGHQVMLRSGDDSDFQEGWLNGQKDYEDVTDIELASAKVRKP